ncbi:DUF2231 domain-containing protein [Sphingobium sp. CR2-8]|uniref:DUF2231 domain-containing protein n=1 Tax=Sphingobium sp. CR2-8 TaxID=1306534 RepID=UPI002DB746CA|nr:DUF2231 domain-containing protein [Sphingobium sp. CR2-8]MEC3910359.1 DUF2231 domain-containing protein [Sphingobium sp. CR2-8]
MPSAPPRVRPLLQPLHGLLLAWPVALFPAALLSDITYLNSAEIQWTNFSAWLITGGLLGGGIVLLWVFIGLVRAKATMRSRSAIYLLLLALMWISGLINAFQHSRDGWSSVGTTGLILSILSSLFALAAGWVAYAGYREDRP